MVIVEVSGLEPRAESGTQETPGMDVFLNFFFSKIEDGVEFFFLHPEEAGVGARVPVGVEVVNTPGERLGDGQDGGLVFGGLRVVTSWLAQNPAELNCCTKL